MKHMQYRVIEKALLTPAINIGIQLHQRSKRELNKVAGVVYTFYRDADETIKIGFTEYFEEKLKNENKIGYKIIRRRPGSRREEKILKITLKELGQCPSQGNDTYSCSERLIRYLDLLGWPVNDLLSKYE